MRRIKIDSNLAEYVDLVGHPEERCGERVVTEAHIKYVFEAPECKEPGRGGAFKWSAWVDGGELVVVWLRKSGNVRVKTVYWKDV